MTMHVKVGGAWKTVSRPSIKVGSAWKTVERGWVKVGGAWKVFYQGLNAVLPDNISEELYTAGLSNAQVSLVVNANGTWSTTGTMLGSGTWLDGGTSADYSVRLTKTSGTGTTINAQTGVWLGANSTRTWTLFATVGTSSTWFGTLEIRMFAAPNTVLDTAIVSLFVDATNT